MLWWAARAVLRRLSGRALVGGVVSLLAWATTPSGREHSPGLGAAVVYATSSMLLLGVLAVLAVIGVMVGWQVLQQRPTLYERINAAALGVTPAEFRALQRAEIDEVKAARAAPWQDDRIPPGVRRGK